MTVASKSSAGIPTPVIPYFRSTVAHGLVRVSMDGTRPPHSNLRPISVSRGTLAADFNSANNRTNRLLTFMGGPRVSTAYGRIGVDGHVLIGGLNFHSGNSGSGTSFAAAFGGGADYWLGHRVGWRIVQFDVTENTNSRAFGGGNGASQPRADFRIATGVIFRFGK
jgi:hypothetical protein